METLFTYSVKVAIAIASFYLFYYLVLRRRKDFRFNRIYLGSSFFLSFLIPLITIQIVRPDSRPLVLLPDQTTPDVLPAVPVSAGPDVMTWIFYGFLVITAYFVVRLIAGYLRACLIVRNSRVSEMGGIRVHISEEDIHPFTFFRKIVVPGSIQNHPDQHIILKHELVHVQEKHTLDILSSEILFLLQWFNPFALMLKAAIRNNLEFLTDQEVVQESDMQRYQLAMVALAGKKGTTPFLNALNGSDLKNRIIMMKKRTENKNGMIRRLMVIPLLTILIAGLSNKEFKAAPLPGSRATNFASLQAISDFTSSDTLKKKKTDEVIVVGYPSGSAKSVTAKKTEKPGETYIIRKRSGTNPDPKETGSGTSTVDGNKEITVVGYGTIKKDNIFSGDSLKVRTTDSGKGTKPLYVLDGNEISSLEGVDPESIESISVLKNESATALYGVKGKDGVIIVTSKKTVQPTDQVLIIIDGKESAIPVKDIDPEKISSVNVLKGESAIKKYGKKGENGVIEITLKKFTEEMSSAITTVDQLRKRIAQNIRYPRAAQENGEQGFVKVYAFVNGEGAITQITATQPSSGFQPVDEVVIVGYGPTAVSLKDVENSTSLVQEASFQVKKLPDLNIPQFKNGWVEFQFNFRLEKRQEEIRLR